MILSLLVTAFVATASLGQMIGPETPVTPADSQPVPSNGSKPRLAATGASFFAVWDDARGGVYGARLDGNGNLLDPSDLPLSTDRIAATAVAAAGTDAVVVMDRCSSIDLVRVSAAGVVTAPRSIGADAVLCSQIELAGNGATFLVVWQGHAELVDRDGNILAGPFITGISRSFAAASNGNGYLIAGVQDRTGGFVALPVGSDGRPATPRAVTAAPNPRDVAVASNGSQYLVITAGTTSGLEATIVKPDGSGGSGASLSNELSTNPRVSWNGHEYVAAVRQVASIGGLATQTIDLARLGEDGHPLGTLTTFDSFSNSEGSFTFDVAGTPDGALVAWTRGSVLTAALSDAAIDAGRLPSAIALSKSAPDQSGARLIRTSGGIDAIWRETTGTAVHLEGALLDNAGRPRTPAVKAGEDIPNLASYKVAFDGTNVVVAWSEQSTPLLTRATILMRRYTSTLQPLDSGALVVTDSGSSDFDLAAGDGAALVVWSAVNFGVPNDQPVAEARPNGIEPTAIGRPGEIDAVLVRTTDGSLQPLPVVVSRLPDTFLSLHPAAAWNSREFLVSWARMPATVSQSPAVLGARLTADGRLLDVTPVTIATPDVLPPAVAAASNGSDFYVVWGSTSYTSLEGLPVLEAVYGARIGGDGLTSGGKGQRLSPAGASAIRPAIVARGNDYLVAWSEVSANFDVEHVDVRVVRAGVDPPVVSFLAAQPFPSSDFPSIAASDSNIVVAYGRFAAEQPFNGVSRIYTRTVAPLTPLRRRPR